MNIQNIESPILVAPSPTPFTREGKVNFNALENNAEKWLSTDLSGFVLGTENGEEQLLSFQEKKDICKSVVSVAKEKKLIIAGIDNPSVKGTLEDADAYINLGVDVLRIRIPRRRDTIDEYFNEVLEKISGPVLIIHQMAPGGFTNSMTTEGADPDQIGRFCSYDSVVGYIASHLVRFEMMTRKFISKDKQFWVPNAMLMAAQILEGANGACFMLGNIAPKICREIMKLGLEGNYSKSKKLNDSLVDADWNILSRGAPGLKYAMDLIGFEGGNPRSPLNTLDENAKSEIKIALKNSGISKVE